MIKLNRININCVTFNQNNTLIGIGTQIGYLIYSTKDFQKLSDKSINIDIINLELYYKSNIIYFIGSHSDTSLLIHDDISNKVQKTIQTQSKIVSILSRTNYINIMTLNKILIYDFECENLFISFNINEIKYPNLRASFSLEYNLFWPDNKIGHITNFNLQTKNKSSIKCHENEIFNFNISYDGLFLVTCSVKGTKIRVYKISTKELLAEFKRGIDATLIYGLSFSLNKYNIICSNDKGTIHFFNFHLSGLKAKNTNKKISKPYIKGDKSIGVYKQNGNIIYFSNFLENEKNIVLINLQGNIKKILVNTQNVKKEFFSLVSEISYIM